MPASGGTPARVAAIAPEKEIDFHSVAVLPDGRLIVTTHLRGQDAVRLDLVDGGDRTSARRRSRHRHRQVPRAQRVVVRATAQESRRVGRAVRWRPDRSDAGDAASKPARATSASPAKGRSCRPCRRASVASSCGSRTGRRPRGPARRLDALDCDDAWCAVRSRAGVARARRPTAGARCLPPAPPTAAKSTSCAIWRRAATRACPRRKPRPACRPADGSRGRRRAGCCTRPEVSRHCRSTTGPRMDRRAAGRSWLAWPRR